MNFLAGFALPGCMLIFSAVAGDTRVVILELERMQCYGCVQTVRHALQKVPGVQEAVIDLDRKTATVKFDPGRADASALTRATAAAGFPSKLRR